MSFVKEAIETGLRDIKISPDNDKNCGELMTQIRVGDFGPTFADLIKRVQRVIPSESQEDLETLIVFAAVKSYKAGKDNTMVRVNRLRRVLGPKKKLLTSDSEIVF